MIQLDAIASATGMSVGELQGMASKDVAQDDGRIADTTAAIDDLRSDQEKFSQSLAEKVEAIKNWLISGWGMVTLAAMAVSLAIMAGMKVVGAIKSLFGGKGFKGLGKNLKSMGKGLKTTFKSVGKTITSGLSSLGNSLKGALSSLGNIFSKSAASSAAKSGAKSGGKSLLGKLWGGAKNLVKKGASAVKNVAKSTYQGAKNVVGAVSNPKAWFKKMMKSNAGAARKALKGGGIVSALFGLAEGGMVLANKNMGVKEKSRKLVQVGAGTVGAIAGGALGSLLGPIGTFLGSMGGQILGDWIGGMPGVQDVIAPVLEPAVKAMVPDKADDFILNKGKMTKFNKDDLVIGGTNLAGQGISDGGGNNEVIQRLDRLIQLVEDGKTVEMDGVRVGEALGLSKLSVGVG